MEITITPKDEGRTIKEYLQNTLCLSNSLITILKKTAKGITVNGSHQTVRYTLRTGDLLTIKDEDQSYSSNIVPIQMPLNILYEDEYLIAINKDPGIPTHPSHDHYQDSLANGLMKYFSDKKIPFVFRACNRLDKNTSGVTLIAKNRFAAAAISAQIKEHRIHKTYLAILDGIPPGNGIIEKPIKRLQESVIQRVVCNEQDTGALYAQTQYTVLASGCGHTFVRAVPITGRTHQLRVHFASIGCPICGDFLYGEETTDISRQALHAYQLTFKHPISNTPLTLTAPLPADIKKLVQIYHFHI